MDAARYLLPAPGGVLAVLSQPPQGAERRLFEHLLLAGRALPLDMPALAEVLGLSSQEVARAVFALNRNQHITVLESEPHARDGWAQGGLAGLSLDLVTLALPGQKILLSSGDGVSIARVGWSPYEADVMAARPLGSLSPGQWEVWKLQIAGRSFRLCANARVDQRHPVLRQFGYRLLRGCRPLLGGVQTC